MFGDLTTTQQRMNQDSAWFDEEFGKPESRLHSLLAFIGMVLLISGLVIFFKFIW